MKRAHFIGIGGVGMAALAVLLKNRGWSVSGCDLASTPRTRWLENRGIPVTTGHDAAHAADAELVVATPAVAADHPERRAAGDRLRMRGDVLARLVNESPDAIAVCGSHGKTTTATWIARLLLALGENVEWAIGGETGAFPVGGGTPGGALVVEADESDGTLAHYRAGTLVVTCCEYDHPDFFKTPESYRTCFDTARRQARTVIEGDACARRADADAPGGADATSVLAPLAPHNRQNARLAIAVALGRGHTLGDILAVLPGIVAELPDRRFQVLWPKVPDAAQPTVVTDYAHHPTEMRCAVAMARARCSGTLRVLFQPHRFSRTKALLDDFPNAFEGADETVICPTYAAFEEPVEGGDAADLYAAVRAAGRNVFLARSCDEAWGHAAANMRAGDVTLLLGAGDIIRLAPRVEAWGAAGCPNDLPVRRLFIGQGSNTWQSDLATGEVYVKSESPAGRPGATLLSDPAVGPAIPWMAGIPGTIGGWTKMNAGAFGHSFSEVLEAVLVDGTWIPASDCGFGYRTSSLVGEIRDVRFRQNLTPPEDGLTADVCRARRKRFPAGTKGSVFRNPSGDAAGRLLEAAGCKGLAVGGAHVWDEHANVIVCAEGARASDFLALAQIMRRRVERRFGVILEPEVAGLGMTPSDCGSRA